MLLFVVLYIRADLSKDVNKVAANGRPSPGDYLVHDRRTCCNVAYADRLNEIRGSIYSDCRRRFAVSV